MNDHADPLYQNPDRHAAAHPRSRQRQNGDGDGDRRGGADAALALLAMFGSDDRQRRILTCPTPRLVSGQRSETIGHEHSERDAEDSQLQLIVQGDALSSSIGDMQGGRDRDALSPVGTRRRKKA
jgi:hypothetical protein